jgi:methyl-accepting chemotaxis protein
MSAECRELLTRTEQSVQEVHVLMRELTAASQQQERGLSEISQSTSQMDQVVQGNAATAEETAAAAEELSAQAESMSAIVRNMMLFVRGSRSDGNGTDIVALNAVEHHSQSVPLFRAISSDTHPAN